MRNIEALYRMKAALRSYTEDEDTPQLEDILEGGEPITQALMEALEGAAEAIEEGDEEAADLYLELAEEIASLLAEGEDLAEEEEE